jgi:hypothetical protein
VNQATDRGGASSRIRTADPHELDVSRANRARRRQTADPAGSSLWIVTHTVPGVDGVAMGTSPPTRMTIVTLSDGRPAGRQPYRIKMVFRHPVQSAGFDTAGITPRSSEGDSGLHMPDNVNVLVQEPQVDAAEFRIGLERNGKGNLGRAIAEFTADSPDLARRIMTVHLGAVLSRLGFLTDAPIAFHWMETVGVTSGHTELAILHRGEDVVLAAWPEWEHHERAFFRNAFAVYREGLNTTDAYWAVLCFIRVIEGVRTYAALASRVMKERGMDLARPHLTLVDDSMIVGPFASWAGKSANAVADLLRDQFRVPVAHGVLPDEPMQAADQLGIENRYWLARPVAQQVAKSLLLQAQADRERLGDEAVPALDEIGFD